jgi:ACS family tartrate transporter-like MFS transporter
LPLIGIGYCISFVDRVNISFAAATMNRDLGFTATVYGLGGGLFFLSYALLEVPSNILLARFGARRWIARIMVTWGLLAAGMMFVKTPLQFYAMRLLLGAAEAGFFPGVIYYLTFWFPAEYRGRAISRFYVALPISNIVMGSLAGGLLGLSGRLGLKGWQWLFLLEGLPAVVMGIVILFLLPDRPEDARWLSSDDRAWLSGRLARDAADPRRRPDHGVMKALLDPTVLGFTAVNFISLGAFYAFNLSAPSILGARTHLPPGAVGYIVAFGGALGAAAMVFNGWSSDRRSERYLHLATPLALSALAYGIMSLITAPAVVVPAYWLAIACNAAIGSVFWLAPGDTIAPRQLAVAFAAMNSVGQLGSFLAASLWGVAKDASGGERIGLTSISAAFCIAVVVLAPPRVGQSGLKRRARSIAPPTPSADTASKKNNFTTLSTGRRAGVATTLTSLI